MSKFAIHGHQPKSLAQAILANKKVNKVTIKAPAYKPLVMSKVAVARPASKVAKVVNKAGGKAFSMSDKMELATGIFASLLGNTPDKRRHMYESEAARIKRLVALMTLDPKFAAKVVLDARINHGLRSITHVMAAHLLVLGRGESWLKDFIAQVGVRADDYCEILGAYWSQVRKDHVPNSFKKGVSLGFQKFDYYRIAKYAGGKRSPSLADVMNLCCPRPVAKNREALNDLAKGTIRQQNTWETRLSNHKKNGKTKDEVWYELIEEGLLGQLGLLRNLRNIGEQCGGGTLASALEQLRDKDAIRKNGILPMQYVKAYETIKESKLPTITKVAIMAAIDDAMEIAAGNVPSIGERVLVVVDESGSMGKLERDNASMFAAVMLKANPQADVMFFASTARYVTFNRKLPLLELVSSIRNSFKTGSTNFPAIFATANKPYDSIVILSDNEGWVGGGAPITWHTEYKRIYDCKPVIFNFDLGGDGALMFREDDIILLSGFSFEVFKLLSILKKSRHKLVDEIDKITIGQPLKKREMVEDDD